MGEKKTPVPTVHQCVQAMLHGSPEDLGYVEIAPGMWVPPEQVQPILDAIEAGDIGPQDDPLRRALYGE